MVDEQTTVTAPATFTQEQVDEIVKARVARYADYNDLKIRAGEAETLRDSLSKAEATANTSKEALNKVVEGMLASIPEDKRALIPADYDLIKKLDYIQTNKTHLMAGETTTNTVTKQEQPVVPTVSTPPDQTQTATTPNTEFGGYSSLLEWSQKDPKGYMRKRRIN